MSTLSLLSASGDAINDDKIDIMTTVCCQWGQRGGSKSGLIIGLPCMSASVQYINIYIREDD